MSKYVVFIYFLFIYVSFSQDSDFLIEKLNIEKKYTPTLDKKTKKTQIPVYKDSIKVVKQKVEYNFQEEFLYPFLENINLKNPPKMSRNYQPYFNNILFRIGTQRLLEIDMDFNQILEFEKDFGVSINHYSENFIVLNDIIKNKNLKSNKYLDLNGFSKHDFSFFGTKEISDFRINSNFDLFNQKGLYYGGANENQLDSLLDYNGLGIDLGFLFFSPDRNSGFNNIEFNYTYFIERDVRSQNYINIKSDFSSDFQLFNQFFDFDFDFDLNLLQNRILLKPNFSGLNGDYISTYLINDQGNMSFLADFSPAISFSGIGLGFSSNLTSENKATELHFFPNIDLSSERYNLSFTYQQFLKPYFFNDLIKEIPYLSPFFRDHFSKNSLYKFNYDGYIFNNIFPGSNGKISTNFNASFLVEKGALVPFLLPKDLTLGSPIGMYFDDSKKLNLSTEISVQIDEIEFFSIININPYFSSTNYPNIRYLPKFSFEFFFQVRPDDDFFKDKVLFSFDISSFSNRRVLIPSNFFVEENSLSNHDFISREVSSFLILNFDIKCDLSFLHMKLNQFNLNLGFRNLMGSKYEIFDSYYVEQNTRFFIACLYSF